RRLTDAQRAGDRIYALIRATGVNQDGRTQGITVPNGEAQEALIHDVCDRAGITPQQVGLVEAHGTGTQVGDPIEANALGNVLGRHRPANAPVVVGSVKTNIGHLEAAAGVAGLMKAALCLKHQQVPPHLHLVEPNPKIDLEALRLHVPSRLEDLKADSGRYAAVNSFGYGGTNAHVLLERPPVEPSQTSPQDDRQAWLVPFSARSDGALATFAMEVDAWMVAQPHLSMAEIGHALAVRRPHHNHRATVVARGKTHLHELLSVIGNGGRDPCLRTDRASPRRLAFVYTGMGLQWWGMGRALYRDEPIFRKAIDDCAAAAAAAGLDGLANMFCESAPLEQAQGQPMPEPRHAQPANSALRIALTTLLRSVGIEAQGIVGHSVGELAAAWAAGVLDLDSVFRFGVQRSILQQTLLGQGGMLAVNAPTSEIRRILLEQPCDVEIAAYNSNQSSTLAGPPTQLQIIAERFALEDIETKKLHVGVGYHCAQMAPLHDRFMSELAWMQPAAPRVALYSSVTGKRITEAEQDVDYWWRNARQPVLLQDALSAMGDDGFDAFLEIGPHPALGGAIQQVLEGARVWSCQRRQQPEQETFLANVAAATCAGVNVDWHRQYPVGAHALRAPRYPFDREFLWSETSDSRADRLTEELHPLVHRAVEGPNHSWRTEINTLYLPWLNDHRIAGTLIYPGAAFVLTGLAIARLSGRSNAVENISFQRALQPAEGTLLQADLAPRDGQLSLSSRAPDEDAAWAVNAQMQIPDGHFPLSTVVDRSAIEARCLRVVDIEALYARLKTMGLDYGPSFQCVRRMKVGHEEALVELSLAEAQHADTYELHPALLDATFHALLGLAPQGSEPDGTFVPVHIERLRIHGTIGREVTAHLRVQQRRPQSIVGEILLLDAAGQCLVEIRGLRCQKVASMQTTGADLFYSWAWEKGELGAAMKGDDSWLVVCDAPDADGLLASLRNIDGVRITTSTHLETALQSPITHIIDLRACAPQRDPTGETAAADLLLLAQRLAAAVPDGFERFTVVTRGAQAVDGEAIAPSSAAVWGLARVISTEFPQLGCRRIDLPLTERTRPASLISALSTHDDEDEVAVRAAGRFVGRLDRWQHPAPTGDERRLDEPVVLDLATPGVLDSLRWVSAQRRDPGKGEVELRLHTASLNFKDLMKAMNMLSSDYIKQTFIGAYLGMECAGTVV
ncbi:MAG: acyltransferase domain-containing protein, partial [Myxococcota bacterium]